MDDGLVWVFDVTSETVKAHAPGCARIPTKRTYPYMKKGFRYVIVLDPEEKADLIERDYLLNVCACAKKMVR